MPSSASFERLKNRGLAAFKSKEYAEAKVFITEAAEQMLSLAGESQGAVREHEAVHPRRPADVNLGLGIGRSDTDVPVGVDVDSSGGQAKWRRR